VETLLSGRRFSARWSVLAGGRAINPFDAACDAQALGVLGMVARKLGRLAGRAVRPAAGSC